MSKSIILVPFVFFIILLFFIYGFFITFTEGRKYGSYSIDNLFLTPSDLSQISKFCENSPYFNYSSADGPKPAIISINCKLEKNKVLLYLSNNNFTDANSGIFKKANIEIEVQINKEQDLDKVTLYEHL